MSMINMKSIKVQNSVFENFYCIVYTIQFPCLLRYNDGLLGIMQILLILFLSVGSEYAGFLSLNTFLRDSRISTGTKYMCKEGGCGTCLVQAKLYEPITMETKSYAVNSVGCL